jgi:CRISPR-associated Csx2 family protein
MGRKVLLSFLGTGPLDSKETRMYKTTEYHLGDINLGSYPFVASALKKHYQVDTIILIGTVHSMWEEVYRWFSDDAGRSIDEDAYFCIANECENANYKSPLALTDKTFIEQAIGGDSKIILIKYGITETEVMENINIILGLQQYLNTNDELIVDITHSFRSLPIFVMNLLFYLKNVSRKEITISHIHYGMLEMSKELGFAPIIDLKAMMEVNDWVTGAYTFSEFGNAYKIAKLVEPEDKSAATLLTEYSNLMNLNHLHAIQKISQRLSALKNKEYQTLLPELTISPIIGDFINRFDVKENKHALFQIKVARWQLDHKKYAQAMLTINEAMVTYVCEQNKLEWDGFDSREFAKAALKYRPEARCLKCDNELKKIYKKLQPLRNSTAHSLVTTKNVQDMLKVLSESVTQLETIIK